MSEKTVTDKVIDFIFGKKEFVILLLIVIFGAIIRAIVAANVGPSADEIVYGTHAIDIIKSGAIGNQNQAILWFYMQDIFYNIFGVTLFSSKFSSFFFGTLTIIVIFLLTKELSNKKTALVASFLYAVSPFATRMMIMEMDTAATFFVAFAIYFFIKDLKHNKVSIPAFVIMGLAYMVKAFGLIYIFSFILVYIIHYITLKEKRKEFITKNNIKALVISMVILIIIVMPILTYNYLLYKEKGLTDVMFVRFMDSNNELFKPIMASLKPFELFGDTGFFPIQLIGTSREYFFKMDPILFTLFILGLISAIIKKNKELIYLTITFLPAYVFTAGTSTLAKHFVFYLVLFSTIGAIFLVNIIEKIKNHENKKKVYISFVLIVIFSSLFILWPHITSTSARGGLRDYAIKNIDDNTVVIVDSRIYRGEIAWMFNDKHYIEASLFQSIIDSLKNLPQKEVPVKTIFIECAIDDCGWGTIKPGQLNDSMEYMVSLFSNMSKQIIAINGGGGYGEPTNKPHFRVYETTLMLKPSILEGVDQTHIMFYYPVRWKLKDQIYDSYTPKTLLDKFLQNFSYLVLWLEIIIAFSLVIILFYYVYKETIEL